MHNIGKTDEEKILMQGSDLSNVELFSFIIPQRRNELQKVQLKLRIAGRFQSAHRKTAH